MRWAWLIGLLVGCGAAGGSDAGVDAGAEPDGHVPVDAGRVDAGRVDAATSADAGVGDAGRLPPSCAVMAAVAPDGLMAPGRGSDRYVAPTSADNDALERSLRALASGDPTSAEREARVAGYRLCRGDRLEQGLWLLAPVIEDAGAARVVLRPDGAPLVLEAPHPFFDSTTGTEAATLFTELGARALVVSGTHRCAALDATACDGTTSVCTGTPAAYPISDPAHDVDSAFHAAHVAIAESYSTDVVVSVHGMSGVGVSISDGTTAPAPADGVVARLAAALSSRFAGVTACNAGVGVPREVRLCGSTNVQGRHVNGSADACVGAPSATSGRFVHLEQSRAVRDDVPAVVAAFREALE